MVGSQHWRTLLFVPGDRSDRITSAPQRGADAIVIDLEDAVPPTGKASARAEVVELLSRTRIPGTIMVRVNAPDTKWFEDDVEALGAVLGSLHAVLLPKAADSDHVRVLDDLLSRHEATTASRRLEIIPMIETAAGVLKARSVGAASHRNATLLFGHADLSTDLGMPITPDGVEHAQARYLVVLASAAAALPPPIDGPYLSLGDLDGLQRSARTVRALGFGGKAVIHPEQIPVVHKAFAIDPTELAWAQKVDSAFRTAADSGRGVARLPDGTFVDEPIVRRARALLDAADRHGGTS